MKLRRLFNAVLALALVSSPFVSTQAHAGATDPDLLEIQHYTLSMDKVNRFYDSMKDLSELSKTHPELKGKLESDGDHENLSAIERRISSQPIVVSTLARHGYSPREFAVFTMAYFQAAFAEAMMKEPGADRAKMMADGHINPANIAFIEQHQTELDALQKKADPGKAAAKQPNGSEDDN